MSLGVIIDDTFVFEFSTNLKSLLVTIPIRFLLSTIGTPDIPNRSVILLISETVEFALAVTGLFMTPLSYFFTNLTCLAWSSIDKFLCMIPIPPSLASVIAIFDSVTVSIAADTIGVFNSIDLVKKDDKFTFTGKISE